MTDITPVRCLEDGWNYVSRLRAFPRRFERIRDQMAIQRRLGIVPPRFVIEKVLKAVEKMADESLASKPPSFIDSSYTSRVEYTAWRAEQAENESALVGGLLERLTDASDGLPVVATVPPALEDACRSAVAGEVASAYQLLATALRELLDLVSADGYTDHAGVGALPDGGAYYAWRLKGETSTTWTPEEVHALGHKEVAAIEAEMASTIERLHAKGDTRLDPAVSVAENMRALAQDPRWLYPDTAEGRDECINDFRSLVADIETKLNPFFDIRPRQVRVPPATNPPAPLPPLNGLVSLVICASAVARAVGLHCRCPRGWTPLPLPARLDSIAVARAVGLHWHSIGAISVVMHALADMHLRRDSACPPARSRGHVTTRSRRLSRWSPSQSTWRRARRQHSTCRPLSTARATASSTPIWATSRRSSSMRSP